MAELKQLGEKPELEEAISTLEERSRVWFETDEEFQQRLQKCLREPAPKAATARRDPSNGGSGGGGWQQVAAPKARGKR